MMSDEALDEAVVTAPDTDATAAPVVVEPVEQEDQPSEVKTFTQEEVDAMIAKARAKEERKWKRQQRPVETPQPVVNEDGETIVDPGKIISEYEAKKQTEALQEKFDEAVEQALEKYDDFEQVAYNRDLPVSHAMQDAIMASDIGPDVLYHLGTNPSEAKRISRLPDLLQAKEIGKIEANLTANPPTPKTSSAPAPIAPVTGHQKGAPVYETTDPRSVKALNQGENASAWIEAERKRMWREHQARNNPR